MKLLFALAVSTLALATLTDCGAPSAMRTTSTAERYESWPDSSQIVTPTSTQDGDEDDDEAPGFAGLWKTTYGSMRLVQDGDHVRGTYNYDGIASVEGDVRERSLHLRYAEPDGTRGLAVFELSEDGSRFTGVWRPGVDGEPVALDDALLARWEGERVEPVDGRVWLVVLESHWESGLAEPEYSYGAMLRAFFQRVPNVEVRQRFVHSRADLVRFLGELTELAEPVVVYISSHASPQGMSIGSDNVDGATIGAALRNAGEIALVHLGGCSTMGTNESGKNTAAEIRAAAAPHDPFPISGFARDADWAGSAVVDFTYLDLVLARGLAPAEAAEQVRSMIAFAGNDEPEGAAIPPAALVVSDPDE